MSSSTFTARIRADLSAETRKAKADPQSPEPEPSLNVKRAGLRPPKPRRRRVTGKGFRAAEPGAFPSALLYLAEAAVVVLAFLMAHWLTLSLHPFRDEIAAAARGVLPWLGTVLHADPGPLRPLDHALWMLGVLVPAIVLPLVGLDAHLATHPSRVLSALVTSIAVASGLAFASLVILTFRLTEWSRLLLMTFGAVTLITLIAFRAAVARLAHRGLIRGQTASCNGLSTVTSKSAVRWGRAPTLPDVTAELGTPRDRHVLRLLERIASGGDNVRQRSLAAELGIALGLVNELLKGTTQEGWITATRTSSNKLRYEITPQGLAEKARLDRQRLNVDLQFYAETRSRIRKTLDDLARQHSEGRRSAKWRVVLYGTGNLAEVSLLVLQDSGVVPVAIVEDSPSKSTLCGHLVCNIDRVQGLSIDGQPFDYVLVTTVDRLDTVRRLLIARGVPEGAVQSIA